MTITDAIDEFLLAKEAGMRSTATVRWYTSYLKPFKREFGGADIATITMRQIARWLIAQTGTEHTRFNRDKILRIFFTWSENAYNLKSPMKAIPLPRLPDPEPKAIDPDDLNRLIEACRNVRDTAILLTLADCGLRASGLISLSIDDVDFAARLIRVKEKRGRVRSVPFSNETERALAAWCKHRPLTAERLFCAFSGQPLTYWGLREILRRLSVRAGFRGERCNLHSLRHFAAREYLRQGGSLPALARILGHKHIDTTVTYYAVYSGSELAEVHDAHSPLNSLKRDVI